MDKSLALEVLDFWLSVFLSIYDYAWVLQRLNQKIIGGYCEIIVSLSRETYIQPLYDNEWYVKRAFDLYQLQRKHTNLNWCSSLTNPLPWAYMINEHLYDKMIMIEKMRLDY